MPVEITARHLEIGENLQSYAQSKAEKLMEEFPKTEFVHIVLDRVRHIFQVQVVLQHKGPVRIESDDSHEDMVSAIDGAVAKSERQLRKHREKIVDHHPHKGPKPEPGTV